MSAADVVKVVRFLFFAIFVSALAALAENASPTHIVYAVLNHSIRLPCPLARSKSNRVEWYDLVYNTDPKPKKIFSSSGNRGVIDENHPNRDNYEVDSNFTLTIRNVRLDDTGAYNCSTRVNQSSVQTKKYYLAVTGHPNCSGPSVMREGQRSSFSCESAFSGNHQPTLEWNRGSEVRPSIDRFEVRLAKKVLDLEASAEDDGMTFTCQMALGDLVKECHVNLTVLYGVRDLTIDPIKTSYAVGDKVRCMAHGNPTPKVIIRPKDPLLAKEIVTDETGVGWRSATLSGSLAGVTFNLECVASNTVQGHVAEVNSSISVAVTDSKSEKVDENTEKSKTAQSSTGSSSGAIVGGIVVGIMILVIIVAAVFCLRLRKERKPKKEENGGSKPTTKDGQQPKEREHQV